MKRFAFLILLISHLNGQFVSSTGEISILGIRVSFKPDNDESTTGNGTFLTEMTSTTCGDYFIDPPPHNDTYFKAQLQAVDSYFRSISKGEFGLDLSASRIVPDESYGSYTLDSTMAYFHPYGDEELQDQRLAEFFQTSLLKAYEVDNFDFSTFDVIVIFHAGIGQDFVLPFLDPTPEDIPSAYIDSDFLLDQLGIEKISFDNGSSVSSGIILPETQNHLLYDIADEIFLGASNPCDYQFGLMGTFALMLGFAIGLPPLWDTETGESGVGVFALMDQGSNNGRGVIPAPPDAWTRIYAGWETETLVRPTMNVELVARDSLSDQIVRVEIDESEYFLIENRNNWVYHGVDIDSLRWQNRSIVEEDVILPSYTEILIDCVDVEIDPMTGVIISVPDYDLGLPGSGLLIWHIDEKKIHEGLNSYSVNEDREHRGIDLEEADGAQDIGYPSIFIFTDPSSGLWSDMWFASNSEYYFANPGFVHQPPTIGPDTYPNTRSNSGSDSYIEINNISKAGKIMSFTVDNSLMASGFPDTSLHIHFFYDFTRDGLPEIMGGGDSLWWSYGDSLIPHYFYELRSSNYQLCITNDKDSPLLVVAEEIDDSVRVQLFQKSDNVSNFKSLWSKTFLSSFPLRLCGVPDSQMVVLDFFSSWIHVSRDSIQWFESPFFPEQPFDSLFAATEASWILEDVSSSKIDTGIVSAQSEGGIIVFSNGTRKSDFDDVIFSTIGVVDLDLDGQIDIVSTDQEGLIFVLNTNFTFESGFPISVKAISPVLVRDLFGDEHPELVVQVDSGDILVLDWQGRERYRLANSNNNKLKILSQYQDQNCIVTESAIWQFSISTDTHGNEWPYVHHDPTNLRRLEAVLDFRTPDETTLFDPRRTYNYPNPTNDKSTTIRVFVESAEKVDIMIYDVAGFFVKQIDIESPTQGEISEVIWNVSGVESGVYFANVLVTKGSKSENKILKIVVVH